MTPFVFPLPQDKTRKQKRKFELKMYFKCWEIHVI